MKTHQSAFSQKIIHIIKRCVKNYVSTMTAVIAFAYSIKNTIKCTVFRKDLDIQNRNWFENHILKTITNFPGINQSNHTPFTLKIKSIAGLICILAGWQIFPFRCLNQYWLISTNWPRLSRPMMTLWHGNVFRMISYMCGETISHW